MKRTKHGLWYLYKALSNELFTDFPSVDIDGISSWEPSKRGALYKDLLIRYHRNKRCAELRAEYRDTYVAPSDRDEPHELAISEAEHRAAFYLRRMEAIAEALHAGAQTAPEVRPRTGTPEVTDGNTRQRRKKKKGKRGGVDRSRDLPSRIAEDVADDPGFWSTVEAEAYGHATEDSLALYNGLLRAIIHAAKARLKSEPGVRVVHTLAKYVLSCFGSRTACGFSDQGPWTEWTTAALHRVKNCQAKEIRTTVLSVIDEYDFSLMPCDEDAGLFDVAKTLHYGRDLVRLTAEHVDGILADKPERASDMSWFNIRRDTLLLWMLTHVHGPFVGNLALSKNDDLITVAAAAGKLAAAKCREDLIGVDMLDFDVERFCGSNEVVVTEFFHAFRNGYRVVKNVSLLTFDQYRRIFNSRFRTVYNRKMMQKEESLAESDAALRLLIGLLLTTDRPAYLLTLIQTGQAAVPKESDHVKWTQAAALSCHLLALGTATVDAVAAILGGQDCFDSFYRRKGTDKATCRAVRTCNDNKRHG